MNQYTITKEFLERLRNLTEANDHTECYRQISIWGYGNAEDREARVQFSMFNEIFRAMKRAHDEIDHFPYGDLRYAVGKEQEDLIVRTFGQKALDQINSAC